jgi:hypothetical protein
MRTEDSIASQVQRLRTDFDDSFSRKPRALHDGTSNFVRLACAGAQYAIGLKEIALLQVNARIVRLPGSSRALRGICCVRGELLAVFSLAVCLGKAESANNEPWIVRATGTNAAFAFERCGGQVKGSFLGSGGGERMVESNGELLALLSLAELVGRATDMNVGA